MSSPATTSESDTTDIVLFGSVFFRFSATPVKLSISGACLAPVAAAGSEIGAPATSGGESGGGFGPLDRTSTSLKASRARLRA